MRIASLVGVLLLWPVTARADSDGYYCHGPGYVAWETRAGPREHTLHLVRFSHAAGIQPTEEIALPDFQVHGMTCTSTVVELAAWSVRYRVTLAGSTGPAVSSDSTPLNAANAAPTANLGQFARAGVIELSADDRTGEFELVIARVSRPVEGGIQHHTVTRLVQRLPGSPEQLVASRLLLEGIFLETIDDG